MSAEPSNETPPISLAVCKASAVDALPSNVSATNVPETYEASVISIGATGSGEYRETNLHLLVETSKNTPRLVYPMPVEPVFRLLKIPVSTSIGVAVPVHLSPEVWPVTAENLMFIPSTKAWSLPVIATPVATVGLKLGECDHSNVSTAPTESILR